jgi:lipoprotein-anchoring transpeptidase ErfK/SrfK
MVGNEFGLDKSRFRAAAATATPSQPISVMPMPADVADMPLVVTDTVSEEVSGPPRLRLFRNCLDFLHRYSLGAFALLFLIVAASGTKVAASYWSAHLYGSIAATSATHLRVQPLHGPNTMVSQDQLASSLQHITAQPISLSIGTQAVSISAATIHSWLQVVPDRSRGVSYIHVNDAAITSTLSQITAPYDKAAVNQVTATHPDGSSTVIIAGSNGSSVGNTDTLAAQISQNVLSGNGLQLNVPFQSVPFQAVTPVVFGKLLEVDVNTHRMYAYDNGQLVNTFLVTAGAPATPTPIGEFHIWEKLPLQTMSGFNPNGTKYVQPNVPWINYFNHSGDAVHGNYWRPASVFGNVNTSHGCVGVQVDDAKWIYDWAPIGTTVITHT